MSAEEQFDPPPQESELVPGQAVETWTGPSETDAFAFDQGAFEETQRNAEVNERGEQMLALLSAENIKSDMEANERFGSGILAKLKDIGANSLRKLETSGENALKWAEEKGVPLPKSKLGNYLAAGGLGIAGLAPGAGLLWGVAYIFAKRAREARGDQESEGSPQLAFT